MAQGKKSVLLYCDLIHTIEKMDNETAGEFFKHYLRYINDQNPKTDNLVVDLTFESVKQNLKRDLLKWENIKEKRSEAGKKSAEVRALKKQDKEQKQTNPTSVKSDEQNSTNPTVTDTVTVTVTVNDILLEKETKELFKTWVDYRKEIGKPIKADKTKISLAKKIQKHGSKISLLVINNSIENAYQGLFWDKFINQQPNTPNKKLTASEALKQSLGL